MANPAYSLVSVRGNFFIQDTNTNQLYSVDGAGRGIENKKQLLQEAVNVLNRIGIQDDLSQVKLMRDGVHIGDQVINLSDIEGYERSYQQIEASYSQTVSHSNHVAAHVMSESLPQMGASVAAQRGELHHEGGLGEEHAFEYLPDAQPPEAAKSALASIAKFFSRLKWPNFLVKVGEVFEKIFSKGTFVARHQNRAQKFMDPTEAKINKVREFSVQRGDKYAYVPNDIILSPELREERDLDHKIGGQEACPENGVVPVDVFKSGTHTVTGYDVRNNGIEPGAVVPTSTRYADDPEVGNHLINCYMTESNGAGIIRTGVIDTPEKAAEFERAATVLNKQMGREDQPVRVMSHQLNSPEREASMIKRQHKHLLARKSESFQAGHLNAPNNRFYHHHKTFKGVPLISDFLSGEKKSHEQNVEGMVQYLAWIVEDLQKSSDLEVKAIASKLDQVGAQTIIAKQVEVDQKFKEITDLESQIDESDDDDAINDYQNQINQIMQEIDNLRTQMIHGDGQKTGLKELHKYITQVLPTIDLKSENIQANPNLKTFDETLNLFGKLLGSQLEIKGGEIDRNQEHLMLFALDKRLGVISAINCKSGLDRTGILFALFLSAMDLPEDKVMDIALNWETYSLALNKLYKAKDYDADLVDAELSKMGPLGQNLKTLFDMQHDVLQHLLKVSLPITGLSTGIIGLKYQKGIAENLLPLYCLPPVVKTEEGNIIRLFTYDSKGKPEGLTDEGHALITQLSPHRGA